MDGDVDPAGQGANRKISTSTTGDDVRRRSTVDVELLSMLRPDFHLHSKLTSSASMDSQHQLPLSRSHGPLTPNGCMRSRSMCRPTDPLIEFSTFEHQHWPQHPKFKPSTESQYWTSILFLVFVLHLRNAATGESRFHCSLSPPLGF